MCRLPEPPRQRWTPSRRWGCTCAWGECLRESTPSEWNTRVRSSTVQLRGVYNNVGSPWRPAEGTRPETGKPFLSCAPQIHPHGGVCLWCSTLNRCKLWKVSRYFRWDLQVLQICIAILDIKLNRLCFLAHNFWGKTLSAISANDGTRHTSSPVRFSKGRWLIVLSLWPNFSAFTNTMLTHTY